METTTSVSYNLDPAFRVLQTYYDNIMVIKIYAEDNALRETYMNATRAHIDKLKQEPFFCDSGFDMYLPSDTEFVSSNVNKVDFGIKCSAILVDKYGNDRSTGYYTYARSSISKTPLRLANNQGIIDAGYRGNLIGMFDLLPQYKTAHKESGSTRLLQICAPNLVPVWPIIVESVEDLGVSTRRGEGGFGSTG